MASLEVTKVVPIERDETYQNKFIDKWDVLPRVRVAIGKGFNIMFRGPTGTGKTYLVRELANEYRKRLLVLNMTAGASTEEVKGRYVAYPDEEGKTAVKWVDGVLVSAMKRGDWVVIEEANFMPEELASAFYSVMDDRRNIILDEHENEIVQAHPEFRLFMTANWGYRGTTIPNDAIRNRVDFYADLPYLPEKDESKLIERETGVNPNVAKLISKFAWSQRKIKSRHQPDISTRILIRWATLVNDGLSPVKAGEHTLISLLYHDEKEKGKVRETMKFEFEALEEEMVKTSTTKTETKTKIKTPGTGKTSSGKINVGDLISVEKIGEEGKVKWYGIVKRITTSRSGDKVWALWNEDKGAAMRMEPSPELPIESREKVSDCVLEVSREDIDGVKKSLEGE
jgi:MoxR-like ATPase